MEKEQRELIKQLIEVKLKSNNHVNVKEMKSFIMEQDKCTIDYTLVSRATFHNFVTKNMKKFQDHGTCLKNVPGQGRKLDLEKAKLIPAAAVNQVQYILNLSFVQFDAMYKKVSFRIQYGQTWILVFKVTL